MLKISLLVIALALFPSAAAAAPQTARGMVVITPGEMPYGAQAGEDALSLALDDWSSVTPQTVTPLLGNPFWHIVLRTAGSASGYDPGWITTHMQPWLPLIQAHPEIDWTLQIGNEPSIDTGRDAWANRWYMLTIYQQLAIQAGWRNQYPMLHWAAAIGPNYNDANIELQWEPTDGGIRDYYDIISVHIYAEDSFSESNEMTAVYNELLSDGFTKAIAITELGLHDPALPTQVKANDYATFINNAPPKVHIVTPFIAGEDQGWPEYALHTVEGTELGNHWSF